MRATAITPVLLYLVFINASWHLRLGAVAAGAGFGVLIGVSRLMVHAHSPAEAIAGCLLGAAVSTAFLWMMLRAPQSVSRLQEKHALPLLLMLLVPVFAAKPAPTEHWLHAVAVTLSGHEKLYSRGYEKGESGV